MLKKQAPQAVEVSRQAKPKKKAARFWERAAF
jgi:hypothetical protein